MEDGAKRRLARYLQADENSEGEGQILQVEC